MDTEKFKETTAYKNILNALEKERLDPAYCGSETIIKYSDKIKRLGYVQGFVNFIPLIYAISFHVLKFGFGYKIEFDIYIFIAAVAISDFFISRLNYYIDRYQNVIDYCKMNF